MISRSCSRRVAQHLVIIFGLVFLSTASLACQEAVRRIEARALMGTIAVDGDLGDSAWARAHFTADFTQKDPVEGAAATTLTEVAFLFDEDALYIGARMLSRTPGDIRAVMARRDNPLNSERILISLDTYLDHRTAYTFGVTATGVRFEYYHPSDNEFNRDFSFNPVWEANARRDSTGWTAEMRIPFSQLRFNERPMQVWGVNINHYIPARNEDVYWVLVPKNTNGWSSRMGELVGIENVRPRRRVELVPYTAANATLRGNRDLNNPFDNGYNLTARAGGDFKMGLGPSLTLDATVNPDFGQVEADPAVVNLSAVETFFDERRPFFTEGANLLRGNGANYFYSRRIGASPRGPASGDFVDRPPAATILGAAKITGRLKSGTSIGVLTALTDQEFARSFDSTSRILSRTLIAPRTGFGVVRVQQEFGANASTIGGSFTAVHRSLQEGSSLAALSARDAVAGGVDWLFRFRGGAYELSGSAGASRVSGDSAVVAAIQMNQTHYFQRPDQTHIHFDPGRTSLAGYFGHVRFAKSGGNHWLYNAGISAESPAWEINDAGRLGAADDLDGSAMLRYRENEPGRIFRSHSEALYGYMGWNFGGIRQFSGLDLETSATLKNFVTATFSAELNLREQADNLTRGGPLMTHPRNWNVNGGMQSSFSAITRWQFSTRLSHDELGGYSYRLNGGLTFRPTSQLEVSVTPAISRELNQRQYITQRAGGPAETFGTRYIFGSILGNTVSTQVRINYALNPDLTFELYAEPFAASGQYSGIGELSQPRTNDLRVYGTDGSTIAQANDGSFKINDGADQFTLAPDFNVLSFRSNLVLRWEWRAGSTLFLVWQQNRSGFDDPTERARVGNLWSAFRAQGDNFLAVKVSYWIPVD
ncbi:MAG: DUF5916 domain-containing protein [Gemmatimonadota bacterium]